MNSRVVVITGGSAGIGAALARELARRGGYALVLASRTKEALQQVADLVRADLKVGPYNVGVQTVVADVTRRNDVERIRDEAVRVFGHVDVWVNNAGQGITRPVLELTDEDVDAIIASNVKSVLYGVQAIVPHFKERGTGHVVNISSFLGRVPLATIRSVYSAAKAAVNSLTANLRVDLRRTHPGIDVSLVMPGIVANDFNRNAIGGAAPLPPPGASPMRPQTSEKVAAVIADVIEHPVAVVYTNPASAGLAKRYYEDIAAFEEGARP